MRLTETHLVELGFEKQQYSDIDDEFHYYTFDLSKINLSLCLISCTNDKVENGEWWVEFLDAEDTKFYHFEHLQELIHAFQVAKEFIEKEKKYSPKKK